MKIKQLEQEEHTINNNKNNNTKDYEMPHIMQRLQQRTGILKTGTHQAGQQHHYVV